MKRKSQFSILVDRRRSVSLQLQIYQALKQKIQTRELTSGQAIPSSRELASDLQVSRNTVLAAYERLLGEGYLIAKSRSGVSVNPDVQVASPLPFPSRRNDSQSPSQNGAKHNPIPPKPFHPSQPDVRLFPIDLWNRCRARMLRKLGSSLLDYQTQFALGLPSLRMQIAKYLNDCRGVACEWNQIAITNGSQHALFMLSQLLLEPRDTVYIEDPGYPGARRAFQHAHANLCSMEVDQNGCVPPVLKNGQAAKLIYITPSRHYPTGVTMPAARRMAILDFARRAKGWLIEDDYDSEFRYSRPPLPSLHSLDKSGRVIYVGSMSKVLFPSLRIGFVVLPNELATTFERLRCTIDDHGVLIDQATLAEFIESGAFFRHIRRCRKVYSQRLEVFLECAQQHRLPLSFPYVDGGMNQTGFFENPKVKDTLASDKLAKAGLRIPALSSFSTSGTSPGLVFGYTAFEPATIRSAMNIVASIL